MYNFIEVTVLVLKANASVPSTGQCDSQPTSPMQWDFLQESFLLNEAAQDSRCAARESDLYSCCARDCRGSSKYLERSFIGAPPVNHNPELYPKSQEFDPCSCCARDCRGGGNAVAPPINHNQELCSKCNSGIRSLQLLRSRLSRWRKCRCTTNKSQSGSLLKVQVD
ncbi:hypothetical protein Mp_4g02310 [Marchantia polymorpha subsp. ruderalis]|uniref:Uncharacterized protein n=2 Tax=Marchantia polymorpha TaxID=3197 RepID=A0AAF6B5G8_MARPO|nr:hypothetical protein MARPO_0080s0068 [Marchantia polymorpha]BBN07252.1 hypothetical protein Mp_4g02310 [Marchantia polymorpha subsp. ruderalis]|eukprot:PTQ34452.1 hypothetical protein MARPO_0080s0068 [Marchantia polymorpha]